MFSKPINFILFISLTVMIFLLFTGCKNIDEKATNNEIISSNASNTKLFSTIRPKEMKNQIKIPVLMYHYVRDENTTNELIVSIKNFEKQMKYLKDNKYKTLSLDELYTILKTKSNPYEKSVVITFDDGYTDNYINAYPILKKYGQSSTIFMISSKLNVKPDYFMTTDNILELQANGIDIENHTETHEKLATIPYSKQLQTIDNGKRCLERTLEKSTNYFAYPYGSYNSDTIKALKATNHLMAFTTKKGYVTEKSDLFELNRFMIFQNTDLDQFKNIVNLSSN